MITPYRFHSIPGNPALGLGVYLPILTGGALFGTTRLIGESPVPIACTLRNVIMRIGAPGGVTAREFQLQVNAVTVATWTFSGSTAEVRDLNDYNLVANDLVTLVYTAQTGTPANVGDLLLAFEIETTSTHERKSLYWSHNALFDSGTPRYHNPFDSASADSNAWTVGLEAGRTAIAPINGSIVGYYTRIRTGVTAMVGTIGLYKNSVSQDGAGATVNTVQSWSGAQAANTTFNRFTEFNLPFVVGDRLVFREDKVSGGTASGHMCVVVEATTEGESICATGDKSSAPATNSAEYSSPTNCDETGYSGPTDAAAEVMGNITPFTLGNMHVGLVTTPGAGNSRLVKTHLNDVDTAISVTITDADTTGASPLAVVKADTTHSISIVDGDRWSFVTTGVSIPAATLIGATWSQFIAPPAPPLLTMTQLVIEVFTDEDEELDEIAECTGDGDIASAVNPDEGVSLATTTAPLYWMEVTLDEASPATVYRWAGMSIPYGEPKEARVLRFGTLTRSLSDIDGGFESASITSELQDVDRTIRTAWLNGTLRGARVDYFCADLATLRSGGEPDRRFRGYISRCEPSGDLTFRLTVEDALTNRLNAIDAQDLQVPTQLIEDKLADNPTDAESFDKAAPLCFGSISDEFGAWECTHVGSAELAGSEELGLLEWFLVSQGVVTVNEVFLAGLGVTADIRVQVSVDAFADGRTWVPQKDAWIEANDWSERDSRRWTLIVGRSTDPAIILAKEGTIPLVVNLCGLMADQSLSSSPNGTINSPARALLLILNNFLVQDATGDWLPILVDGDVPLFDTDSFEAVHDALEDMAGTSYTPAIAGAVGGDWAQRSWRDRVAEFCVSFGYDIGINHHGQVILSVLDTTDASLAFSFTPDQILAGSVRFPTRLPVENEVRYVHTRNYLTPLGLLTPEEDARLPRDTFSSDWLSGIQTVTDAASIAALGGSPRGRRRSAIQEYNLSRNEAQSDAVAQRRLDLLSPPNGRIEVAIGLSLKHGCDLELGQVGDAEHWDLPWEDARACRIHRLEEDMDNYVITPTLRDVEDLRG